jgi:hypothetical protein
VADAVYLESFDSVRAPWQLDLRSRETQYVGASMEALMMVAFGRDLVIQQSYAHDSWVFLNVLRDVRKAYNHIPRAAKVALGAEPLPVRLHLFRAESFAEVFRGNVIKMGSPGDGQGGRRRF